MSRVIEECKALLASQIKAPLGLQVTTVREVRPRPVKPASLATIGTPRVSSRPKAVSPVKSKQVAAIGIAGERSDATPRPTKSVISRAYKTNWKNRAKDQLSLELEQAMLASENGLKEVAKENGVAFKWDKLNVGMQRMNLGNVLRNKLARGETVTVMGVSIK